MSNEVLTRWRAFVQKITGRQQEIMNEASAGFEGLLADPDFESGAFSGAMKAIEIRCIELRTTLATTYSTNVVMALMGQVGDAEALWRDASSWMETSFARFEAGWKLRLVRRLWEKAEPTLKAPVPCVTCGADLKRSIYHRHENVKCPHCAAVNSVSPSAQASAYFNSAHLFAQAQNVEGKIALDKACENGAAQTGLEGVVRNYWTAYAQSMVQIMPTEESEKQRFIEGKIEQYRRNGW